MVDDSKDGVLPLYLQESSGQVHRYLLKGKGILRGANLVQGNPGMVSEVLVLLAGCTSLDIQWAPKALQCFAVSDCLQCGALWHGNHT
jgi:hypothetical protein